MGLFAEVKVRRDGMLEEVDDQIAQQNQKRGGPSTQLEAFGNHLDESSGQHESRAQRDKVTQITPLPVPLDDDGAAKNIGGGSRQAKQDAGCDGMHLLR